MFLLQGKQTTSRDEAAEQITDYAKAQKGHHATLTTASGAPIADKLNTLTVGPRGPVLLQDITYIEEMAHFDRERIPERVVHAKGAGAFGTFEVTHDITRFTRANLFSEIGKKTPVAVRFSFVIGESGAADTIRELRGFAVKFYTEEGNWDLVGNNTPIFFIRDPLLFPSLIHSMKRNPVTHLKDSDMLWDFLSLRPETTHQVTWVFADRGIPDGYRHMDGFGSHTFKLVNKDNHPVYCKFHHKTNQGVKNLPSDVAHELTASDPDYGIRDLYNAIARGDFPSWTTYIQVMTFEQAATWKYNPFDLTKTWPVGEFPLIEVGRLTLDRNPINYFAEVEQIAFSPAFMVPGIEPSPDKMLQGRLFAYPDTHRYRLGANFQQIPVNSPYRAKIRNYERDGRGTVTENQKGAPNYYPNSFFGPVQDPKVRQPPVQVSGDVDRYESEEEDNFTQAGEFWREELDEAERSRLVRNLAAHLSGAQQCIQERAVNNFTQADQDYGRRVKAELENIKATSLFSLLLVSTMHRRLLLLSIFVLLFSSEGASSSDVFLMMRLRRTEALLARILDQLQSAPGEMDIHGDGSNDRGTDQESVFANTLVATPSNVNTRCLNDTSCSLYEFELSPKSHPLSSVHMWLPKTDTDSRHVGVLGD